MTDKDNVIPEDKTKDTALILPFGKHKGEPIDQVMRADSGWVEWVMAQPWFREKHPTLVQVIVNGGALADADTPEHNNLQALFLDPAMCAGVYRSIVGDAEIAERLRTWLGRRSYNTCCDHFRGESGSCTGSYGARCPYRPFEHKRVEEERRAGVAPYEARIAKAKEAWKAAYQARDEAWEAYWRRRREANSALGPGPGESPELVEAETAKKQARALAKSVAEAALNEGEKAAQAEIEEVLAAGAEHAALFAEIAKVEFEVGGWDVTLPEPGRELPGVAIELKPSLGDDYPAVLRKLKSRRRHGRAALIVDRFAADGASWDQVVRIFEASGFIVRTLAEIQRVMEQAKSAEPGGARGAPAVRLESFEDLVRLARVKRDIELVRALERDMRVDRFEAGESGGGIAFQPVEGDGRDLAQTLARRLMEWTGERWLVAIVRSTAPTWRERREAMGGGTEH